MITTEQRAELRRLLEEANSPGEWRTMDIGPFEGRCTLLGYSDPRWPDYFTRLGETDDPEDAALIVALRNNAEGLLDAADWFDHEIERVTDMHLDSEVRAGKLVVRAEQPEAENARLRAAAERVEKLAEEWERSSARPLDNPALDWEALHAARIRTALAGKTKEASDD